jgi:hypothetical protein
MHNNRSLSTIAAGIGAGVLVALAGVAPASAADGDAQLSVFHGVPGLTVDVYVNNALTLDNFARRLVRSTSRSKRTATTPPSPTSAKRGPPPRRCSRTTRAPSPRETGA